MPEIIVIEGYVRSSVFLDELTDTALLDHTKELLGRSSRVEAELIAHLAEVDTRKLYLGQACSSMFAYCTERLHLSENMAYRRIQVARLSRRFPQVLAFLAKGRLHLTGLCVLAPHLTKDNIDGLLERASHCSKRRIEELVVEVSPKPEVPDVVRKLPTAKSEPFPGKVEMSTSRSVSATPSTSSGQAAATNRRAKSAVMEPLAPARYKVEFTASAALKEKLGRLQSLLGAKGADSDLAAVVEAAVDQLLEKEEARRFAKVKAPRRTVATSDTSAKSRAIPAAIKREVFQRDGGRCALVDDKGRRCSNDRPGELEYHHTHPFALGGDHRPNGLELRCRAHNQFQADLDVGTALMNRHRRKPSEAKEPGMVWGSRADCRARGAEREEQEQSRVRDSGRN